MFESTKLFQCHAMNLNREVQYIEIKCEATVQWFLPVTPIGVGGVMSFDENKSTIQMPTSTLSVDRLTR